MELGELSYTPLVGLQIGTNSLETSVVGLKMNALRDVAILLTCVGVCVCVCVLIAQPSVASKMDT